MIAQAFNFCKGYIYTIVTIKETGRLLAMKRLTIALFMTAIFVLYADATPLAVDTIFVPSNITARIDFKVNQTDWETSYHGNDTILNKALAAIDSIVLDPRIRVKRITVVGTASPEGT